MSVSELTAPFAAMRRPAALGSPRIPTRALLFGGFVLLVLVALFADSRWLLNVGVNGQPLSNVLVPAYLAVMVWLIEPRHRLIVLLVVPCTTIGEFVLSIVLGLYTYKFEAVPFYVPFGHAVLFAAVLLVTESSFVQARERILRPILLGFYALLFTAALLVGDTLSLLFLAPFALVMALSRARMFYLVMGVLVLYVECTGALIGCWRWSAAPLGLLHSTNPPLGVYTIYIVGDTGILLVRQLASETLRLAGKRGWLPHATGILSWFALDEKSFG